jgi:class 3 adenylate cyclase
MRRKIALDAASLKTREKILAWMIYKTCQELFLVSSITVHAIKDKWFNEGISKALQLRCGINTGMVNVGGFGSETQKDYTAFGMHVNLASRLENACDPGGILVSHSTWALVKDHFQFESRGEINAKGFSHTVLAYNLILGLT